MKFRTFWEKTFAEIFLKNLAVFVDWKKIQKLKEGAKLNVDLSVHVFSTKVVIFI
jgi:hypothetical protein